MIEVFEKNKGSDREEKKGAKRSGKGILTLN